MLYIDDTVPDSKISSHDFYFYPKAPYRDFIGDWLNYAQLTKKRYL